MGGADGLAKFDSLRLGLSAAAELAGEDKKKATAMFVFEVSHGDSKAVAPERMFALLGEYIGNPK